MREFFVVFFPDMIGDCGIRDGDVGAAVWVLPSVAAPC